MKKHEIQYMPALEAIAKIKYLYDYNRDLYTRENTELTVEEYINYQMALTMPKVVSAHQDLSYWIEIEDTLLVFEFDGELYLASGNSRLQTISKMVKGGSKEDFAPVPYRLISEWTDDDLLRIQYNTNDTTRKNSRLIKLKQIAEHINRFVASGGKPSDVKKRAQILFGISPTEIKNALKLTGENVNQFVSELLNTEQIKTDTAVELLEIQKVLKVEPETVCSELMKDGKKFSRKNVEDWRKEHVKKGDTKESRVELYLNENQTGKVSEIITGTNTERTESTFSIDVSDEPIQEDVPDNVPFGNYHLSVENAKAIAYVIAATIDHLPEAEKMILSHKLVEIAQSLSAVLVPPNIAEDIKDALG